MRDLHAVGKPPMSIVAVMWLVRATMVAATQDTSPAYADEGAGPSLLCRIPPPILRAMHTRETHARQAQGPFQTRHIESQLKLVD